MGGVRILCEITKNYVKHNGSYSPQTQLMASLSCLSQVHKLVVRKLRSCELARSTTNHGSTNDSYKADVQ